MILELDPKEVEAALAYWVKERLLSEQEEDAWRISEVVSQGAGGARIVLARTGGAS